MRRVPAGEFPAVDENEAETVAVPRRETASGLLAGSREARRRREARPAPEPPEPGYAGWYCPGCGAPTPTGETCVACLWEEA